MSYVAGEFKGDSMGHARLDERLHRIVSLAASEPSDSFPEQMASVADREALYRFLANPKVTMAGVLSGHLRQTRARLREHAVVRVVHDTTTFRFVGDRDGLGRSAAGPKDFSGTLPWRLPPTKPGNHWVWCGCSPTFIWTQSPTRA